jgi:hypothetical protein
MGSNGQGDEEGIEVLATLIVQHTDGLNHVAVGIQYLSLRSATLTVDQHMDGEGACVATAICNDANIT